MCCEKESSKMRGRLTCGSAIQGGTTAGGWISDRNLEAKPEMGVKPLIQRCMKRLHGQGAVSGGESQEQQSGRTS